MRITLIKGLSTKACQTPWIVMHPEGPCKINDIVTAFSMETAALMSRAMSREGGGLQQEEPVGKACGTPISLDPWEQKTEEAPDQFTPTT